jgi:SPP1 gp7 family putative phage head morphogenesis protein
MQKDYIELNPIRGNPGEWDKIERAIIEKLRKLLYAPIMAEFADAPHKALKNAVGDYDALFEALRSGRVTFSRGTFSGRFNASTSKELKRLGAQWDRKTGTFKAPMTFLPMDVQNAIRATEYRFHEKIAGIDKKLAQILPENIAGAIRLEHLFDSTLWKTDKDFHATVKGITIAPELTAEQRKKIAEDWQDNLELTVKGLIQEQITQMRKDLQKSVFTGNRYQSAVGAIQKSYGVSANKAKFWARQETKLLITKFQETRYADAGIYEYTWHAVAGSPLHPVRKQHEALAKASQKGKIYRYDDPPITTEPGQPVRRNNPGQDYNCRCHARPVVRFKKK